MSKVQDLINEIRLRGMKRTQKKSNTKNQSESPNPRKYISAWLEDEVLKPGGSVIKALVVVLRTHGCTWAREGTRTGGNTIGQPGGCSMCGYLNDCLSISVPIRPEDIITQFKSAIDKFENANFQLIKIFTSGSYLDDAEVPLSSQKKILELSNDMSVNQVLFESRPEFVTNRNLKELSNLFKGKIQLALGLESANNDILNYAIHKGFRFEDYCIAVETALDHEILIKTYLLLKPPFLSEYDAIIDVIESIKVLSDRKLTECISINPVNIQKFTLVEYLFTRHDYRPPWLWSVIEVLKQGQIILEDSNIRLLSQPTGGGSNRGAHNCGECDKQALEAISEFSKTNNSEVLNKLSCDCQMMWEDTINLENVIKSTNY